MCCEDLAVMGAGLHALGHIGNCFAEVINERHASLAKRAPASAKQSTSGAVDTSTSAACTSAAVAVMAGRWQHADAAATRASRAVSAARSRERSC